MKAIGIKESLPIDHKNSFIEAEVDKPVPAGHDLLVRIHAVSVNPVDCKVRKSSAKDKVLETPKILGYDAAGVVEAVGEEVTLFEVGDAVFYAGDIKRSGSNAEYQLVDERIVGKKPKNLSDEAAAAMPLTSLTAWEAIFDRLHVAQDGGQGQTLLIIGGAGGVGSIAIQLAKQLTQLTVIATASRPESTQWCLDRGADLVANHHNLLTSVQDLGYSSVDYILNFADTNLHWEATSELIKPQGHICSIVENDKPLEMKVIRSKSVSFTWELMFTRSMYQTDDMVAQHHILNNIADLLDNKTIQSSLTTTLEGLTVENFKKAHAMQESGKSIGKTVIKF